MKNNDNNVACPRYSDLDGMTKAYIECALWCSVADLDVGKTFQDLGIGPDKLSPECLKQMADDCSSFQEECQEMIEASGLYDDQVGHDFWLTRNRHGAGFWDRGLEKYGHELTEAAHSYGSCDLYLGDDGLIYCT